jgi:hypothetical protein
MMWFLVRDQVLPSLRVGPGVDVDRRVLIDTWTSQDEWLVIRLGDREIGSMRTTAEQASDRNSYFVTAHVQLRWAGLQARVISAAQMNRRLELESFRARAVLPGGQVKDARELIAKELPPGVFEVIGRITGLKVQLRARREDATNFVELPLARPATMIDSLAPLLRGNVLKKGVVYSQQVYDPLFGAAAANVELIWVEDVWEKRDGAPILLRRMELRMGERVVNLFVDPDGNVARREIPLIAGLPGAPTPSKDSAPKLVLERLTQAKGRARFPELLVLPLSVDIEDESLTGTNSGNVASGFNLFSLLGSSLPGGSNPGK